MKIATWNVRGIGSDRKRSMVKNLIKREHLDLIGITKTKHSTLSHWDIVKLWGHQTVDDVHVLVNDGLGRLIISWHKDSFQ